MKTALKYVRKTKPGIQHFAFFLFFVLIMTSCVSKSKLVQQVSQKTAPLNKSIGLYANRHLVLSADSVLAQTADSFSVNRKSSCFIPLIIYWGWNQKYEVKLPDQYLINIFNNILIAKDKDFEYHKFFRDKTLEIEITALPANFYYSLSGTYWFLPYIAGLGLYYSYAEIYPDKQKIAVNYRFTDNESVLKSGKKSIEMKYPVSNLYNPAAANFSYYIDDFRSVFEYLCGRLIEMVVDDL